VIYVCLILLLAFIALALPMAAVLGVLGFSLAWLYSPLPLERAFASTVWEHSIDFSLAAIPLFVLMGEILLRSKIADRMYGAIANWISWLPGGLMHANIGASAGFAATSGSSVATAATIGTVSIPQIRRRGYNERLFLGSMAAGGTLGILIPPSTNMIVYGSLTNTSIPKLFLAGIVPGILLALLFSLVILIACVIKPAWDGKSVDVGWHQRWVSLQDLLAPLVIFILVIGSIYAGWATPTEAAAIGVVCALAIAAVSGRLNLEMLRDSMEGTVRTSCMMLMILTISYFLNFVFASIGVVRLVNDALLGLGLGPVATIFIVIGIYIVLGMFMETLAMVVLTVPIMTPIAVNLGFDPVWFGIVIVLVSEMALLTPPIGMLGFVIQGLRTDGELKDVFIGVIPFLFMIFLMIGLLIFFPGLALWVPDNLSN